MRSQETVTNTLSILSLTPVVTCCLLLDPVKCLLIQYSLKLDKTTRQLHCHFVGGASHLMCSACSTCKSFCAPPFMLLLVPYNFLYYNYIIITKWLVGWFWSQCKRGFALAKKSALWPHALFSFVKGAN